MKKFLFVVMAFAIVACDNTVKTPLDNTDYTLLSKEGKEVYGIEDSYGRKILPVKYREIHLFSANETGLRYFHAVGDKKEYLFDADGNEICCADQLQRFPESFLFWKLISHADSSVRVINLIDRTVSEPYLDIKFAGRQFVVTSNFGEGILSFSGELIIPDIHDKIYVINTPKKWYYIVEDNGKYKKYNQIGSIGYSVSKDTREKIKKTAKPSKYETGWDTPKEYDEY